MSEVRRDHTRLLRVRPREADDPTTLAIRGEKIAVAIDRESSHREGGRNRRHRSARIDPRDPLAARELRRIHDSRGIDRKEPDKAELCGRHGARGQPIDIAAAVAAGVGRDRPAAHDSHPRVTRLSDV